MHATRAIHRHADRHLGLITRAQLRAFGLTDTQISHLVEVGSLVRVHRAVYRLPGSPQSLEQRALAACLACGPRAVASGTTAAGLWKLLERPSGLIEVSIPRGRSARHDGVVARTRSTLPRADTTWLGKIPVTTVPRTIKDLPRALKEEAFDTAIRDRRVTPHVFLGEPGYLGKLANDRLGLGVPHWKIERRAIAVLRSYGLPDPIRQFPVHAGGREYHIDLAYPEKMIAIELKGEAPHWGRERFQYDIDRSNALKLSGWDEYTFTWMRITQHAGDVAAIVTQALRRAT